MRLFLALPSLALGAVLKYPAAEAAQVSAQLSVKKPPRVAQSHRLAAAAGNRNFTPSAHGTLRAGEPEARLIEIYRLIGEARGSDALVRALGDVPDTQTMAAAAVLADLREESRLRLKALREYPPSGSIPTQFLSLSPKTRHAIAVDAATSRLYLFENSASALKLIADFYISIGKSGTEKTLEGDQHTPLGVCYITSNLNPTSLNDYYGAGALPINHPNPLDISRGKTGCGIWLHETPPGQFARAPKASDGCVVLVHPDLERIIRTVEARTTPVVIVQPLHWAPPHSVRADSQAFEVALRGWRTAKTSGDLAQVLSYYSPDFRSFNKTLQEWTPAPRNEIAGAKGRDIDLKDLSFLRRTDSSDVMVAAFGEVVGGAQTGLVKRQCGVRLGAQWKVFFEGVIG